MEATLVLEMFNEWSALPLCVSWHRCHVLAAMRRRTMNLPAIVRQYFGGMFGWDEYLDHHNFSRNSEHGLYSCALQTYLDEHPLLDLIDEGL